MKTFKHNALALGIAMAISGVANADSSQGVELISNGDFSSGLEAWEEGGRYMASNSPYTPDVSIVDDSPNSQALKLSGVSGSNYYATVAQEVNLTSSFSSFDISFDWKVTEKESTHGATYVTIRFLNEEDVTIGYVSYWDTGRQDGHTLSYWRGDLEETQFIGVRKYLEVFDWERVSVNTSAMTGMDPSQVAKISVGFAIQNDAGRGGVMLVDNFSIIGNTDEVQAPNDSGNTADEHGDTSGDTGSPPATNGGNGLYFTGIKPFYDIGETVIMDLAENLQVTRFDRVDLWVAIQMPNGVLLFMTELGFKPFDLKPQPFRKSLDNTTTTHRVLDFEVVPGLGGDYNFYAVYVQEGKNPMTDSFLVQRSNIAMVKIVLSNE